MRIAYLTFERAASGSAAHIAGFMSAIPPDVEVVHFNLAIGGRALSSGPRQRRQVPLVVRDAALLAGDVLSVASSQGPLRAFQPRMLLVREHVYRNAGRRLARLLRIPYVSEVNTHVVLEQEQHGRGLAFPGIAARGFARNLASARRVITVSETLRSVLGQDRRLQAVECTVVTNGVDSTWRPLARDRGLLATLGLTNGRTIGFHGGMRSWHGLGSLIRMLPELRTSDAKVLLVGDGPALQGALTLAGDLGVRKRVVSIGRINHDEVPRYVGLFDIAVMPYDLSSVSLYFSPLKLFEYLALGVPIVSVDAGQMRDVLGGSGAAVLLPDASPQAIAVAVDGLLADSRRRASMVARAVALATRYTWEANARAICDVCIEAVHPRDSAIGKGE